MLSHYIISRPITRSSNGRVVITAAAAATKKDKDGTKREEKAAAAITHSDTRTRVHTHNRGKNSARSLNNAIYNNVPYKHDRDRN